MVVPTSHRLGFVDVWLLIALSVMWGLSFLFIELALREVRPLWIVSARTIVGGAVLLGILGLRRRRLPRGRRAWTQMALLGTLNNTLPWTAVVWAQQSLASGLVALLLTVIPMSALFVSAVMGLEPITLRRFGGLLLAMAGVGAIAGADLEDIGRVVAVLTVLGATLIKGFSAVYIKRFLSGVIPPMELAAGQMLCAAAVALPLAIVLEGPAPSIRQLDVATIGSLLILGAMGTGVAFYVFYILIDRVGATNATMTQYLIPFVAIVAGSSVLGERLGWSAAGGGVLIAGGIWLSQQIRPRRTGDRRSQPRARIGGDLS